MRVYLPWNNLGCLGVRIGRFYADVFRLHGSRFPLAAFVTNGRGNRWYVVPFRIIRCR